MRDDEDDRAHTVPTIPPPSGDSDPYGAQTQVGGLSPEALAMLRQFREEKPASTRTLNEANVPVFVDDASPSERPPSSLALTPVAPSPATPNAATSAVDPSPAPPVFTIPKPPLAPREASSPRLDAATLDPPSPEPAYAALFAPVAVGPAVPSRPPPAPSRTPLMVVAVLVLVALAVLLLGQAGLVPGLKPLGAAPPASRAP